MLSISRFFDEVLGARLANPRWSWGAQDSRSNRVYLRVWDDEIKAFPDGERVLVLRKSPRRQSAGYPQRVRHLEAIKNGAHGIGVVCTARIASDTGERRIIGFDRKTLLLLDALVEDKDGDIYATIGDRVPLEELTRRKR